MYRVPGSRYVGADVAMFFLLLPSSHSCCGVVSSATARKTSAFLSFFDLLFDSQGLAYFFCSAWGAVDVICLLRMSLNLGNSFAPVLYSCSSLSLRHCTPGGWARAHEVGGKAHETGHKEKTGEKAH